MLDRTYTAAADRIERLVSRLLERRAIHRRVTHDDDLVASGLSSLDLVDLMLLVESEFDLKIPDARMSLTNFRSISGVATLLEDLRRERQQQC